MTEEIRTPKAALLLFGEILLFLGVVGLLVWACTLKPRPRSAQPKEAQVIAAASGLPGSPDNGSETLSPSVLEKVKASTVLIGQYESEKLLGIGTGFCCQDPHYIITCLHVVVSSDGKTCGRLALVFHSGTPQQKLVVAEPEQVRVFPDALPFSFFTPRGFASDMALIRLKEPVCEPLALGATEALQESQSVWSVAFPGGIWIQMQNPTGLPTPSVLQRQVARMEKHGATVTLLQTIGVGAQGESGGPVVNAQGEVVGVNESLQERTNFFFAEPSAQIRRICVEATAGGGGEEPPSLAGMPDNLPPPVPDTPPPPPLDVSATLVVARKRFESGRYGEALALASRALTVDPANVDAHRLMGECLFMRKQPALAIGHFTLVLNADPTDLSCLILRAHAYQKIGSKAEALQDFNAVGAHADSDTQQKNDAQKQISILKGTPDHGS